MIIRDCLIAALLLLCSTVPVGLGRQAVSQSAPTVPPRPQAVEAIRARINELIAAKKIPSMAVAVALRGQIVWEEGFGWADIENRVPASPDTVYTLASVGKSVTATAVMIEAQRGDVRLDDPVRKYLAAQGRAGATERHATIRQLLTMRGGIPHMWWHHWLDDKQPPPGHAELAQTYGVECFPPGLAYHYSNMSYGIVREVVEAVSHTPFDEYLASEVFGPLEMKGSSLRMPRTVGPRDARSYAPDGGALLPYWYSDPEAGAAYRSSAHDLALYGMLHLKEPGRRRPAGLTDAAIDALHNPPPGFPYGYGWAVVDDESGIETLISNGGIVGATSMLKLVPSERLAVVCLTNAATEDRITDAIADEVIAAYIPAYRKSMRIPPGIEAVPFTGDRHLNGIWKGVVRAGDTSVPMQLTIAADGNVDLALGTKRPVRMSKAEVENGFLGCEFDAELPVAATAGEPHRLELYVVADGDRLFGYVLATTTGARPHFGLPFRVEARRIGR